MSSTDKMLITLDKYRVRRGEYRIIAEDGTETLIEEKPTLGKIQTAIGASFLDSVKFPHFQVMMVDDTGMVDRRPVNAKATELYHAKCRPGTIYAIHGPVAIVNDMDFA